MSPYNSRMAHCHAPLMPLNNVRWHLAPVVGSTRPASSLIAATLSSAVMWTNTGFSTRSILVGLTMWAVTAFGFVVNDILDYRKDTAAGVKRPIATGALSRRGAFILALVLLLAAFILSAVVGSGANLLAATVLALALYTPVARSLPLLKGLYVAGLCLVPLCYGAVVSHANYSWITCAALAAFIFGRETVMDANELNGDRNAGMMTIAAALGQRCSRWIGASIMALALAYLTLVSTGAIGRIAAALSLASLLLIFAWPRLQETRRVELSRLSMLAAAVAVACG